MKKLIVILALSAVILSACNKDSESQLQTPAETKIQELMAGFDGQVDMDAFVKDAQNGIWGVDEYDTTYTNGEVKEGRDVVGGSLVNVMMLLPDDKCRAFFDFDHLPEAPMVYKELQWSVSVEAENALALYSPEIEESAKTAGYTQYAARTTLELLYYKDGVFIMQGLQPFAYWGGEQGVYWAYHRIVGHIATDRDTVDKYLSYVSYEQFKEENPDLF